jgi:hypothetical protein
LTVAKTAGAAKPIEAVTIKAERMAENFIKTLGVKIGVIIVKFGYKSANVFLGDYEFMIIASLDLGCLI